MLTNTAEHWGRISQLFHWWMGLAMVGMIAAGFAFHEHWIPDVWRGTVYTVHKNTGLALLILAGFRIMWRLSQPTPRLPTLPRWQRFAYQLTTLSLYALMIAFPLSGALMGLFKGHALDVWGVWSIPGFDPVQPALGRFFNRVHFYSGYLSLVFLGMHLAGGLYHHLILKDAILRRMWRRA